MATTEKGIYYPNDGTKVADILTDMKKMAGSIDEVIGENEFDPSQLNQSITDLQQNVTNLQESQTAQDNEINQIKGTLTNKETEIAKSIHIEDAEGFGKLSILGNHEQNEEPSEENPVEIKCLGDNKKNLFSLDNKLENVKVNSNYEIENDDEYTSYYAELEVGEDYVITCKRDPIYASYTRIYWACFDEIPATGKGKGYTFYDKDMNNQKINAKKKYFVISFIKEIVDEKWIYDIQLEKGTVATSFVPYGQGSTEIKIENSDKTQDLTYVLPIQQEMLKGDVFSKELDGWKELHNWQKIDSYNGENITTDYISTTGSLTTGATVFYKLQTPKKIPCTEEQSKILNQLNALDLFEGVNDITTTENIALLQLKYVSNVDGIDILEQEIEKLNTTKVDKVPGKGLSTEDYTTEEKQKLAGLTNYDDTEIKEDIAKIQEEQTTQNQKIEKIEDNQIHIETEQSSTINVQDCSNLSAKIDVYGVSSQETRSGKNKLVYPYKDLSGSIIEDLGDGRLKLNGTLESNKSRAIQEFLLKAGTYKLIFNKELLPNQAYFILLNVDNGEYIISGLRQEGTFELSEDANVRLSLVLITGTYSNYELDLMILESTQQDETFEQYGASPSPEFPSEIENVEGDIDITIENEDKSQTQTIIFPLQEGQKLYEGSYLAGDGIHHVRKQIELDGTENWEIYAGYANNAEKGYCYYLNIADCKIVKDTSISTHFKNVFGAYQESVGYIGAFSDNLRVKNKYFISNKETLEKFKAYLAEQKTAGTPVILEYELETEEIEAFTEEQQEAYNQLQNVTPYKLVTNISTDKAKLVFKYIADTKTYIDNKYNSIKEQLKIVNELLSTTKTSAMLLDNMQTDLESEVL